MIDIRREVEEVAKGIEEDLHPVFAEVDAVYAHNSRKVLDAFVGHRVTDTHLHGTTGYGYDDTGRDAIDAVLAHIMGAPDAIVRHTIVNGTHAIATCLYAVLRPGDTLLCATGKPYDTLRGVIGMDDDAYEVGDGSLRDYGIGCAIVPLIEHEVDHNTILSTLAQNMSIKAVLIQKSCGYDWRPALSTAACNALIGRIKSVRDDVVCIVDNCYGELVEVEEPRGDMIAGSLIKNLGGGISVCGGYIAGASRYVTLAANRLSNVGQGREVGATHGFNRDTLQGLYHAPQAVNAAVRTAHFAAALFERYGYDVHPLYRDTRHDIVQMIRMNDAASLVSACKGIQAASPINSHLTPEPWAMPGYAHNVIMAAGTFTQGASIELSADAPLVSPYILYMQGGVDYHMAKLGIMNAISRIL